MPDLDSVAAELDAMLADTLLIRGSSRALLSQGDSSLFLTPSSDNILRVHAHLLELVSQAPAASGVLLLGCAVIIWPHIASCRPACMICRQCGQGHDAPGANRGCEPIKNTMTLLSLAQNAIDVLQHVCQAGRAA